MRKDLEGIRKERQECARATNKTERQLSDIQSRSAAQKEEIKGCLDEISSIGAAFEEMLEQNARLMQQLKEQEDSQFRVMAERVRNAQVVQGLKSLGEAAEQRYSALNECQTVQTKHIANLEQRIAVLDSLVVCPFLWSSYEIMSI